VPRRVQPDPILPILALATDALASGLTRDQVRYRVDSSRWQRVARGAYVTDERATSSLDEHAAARLAHVHRTIAAASRNAGTVIAYRSAAHLHGLPVLCSPDEPVALAVSPGQWTGRRSGIVFRRLRLEDSDVLRLRVPVTTIARTWLDVACRGTLADALAAGDGGLRAGDFTRAELSTLVGRAEALPGRRRAERALPLLTAERESPLESASYAYFVEQRLPLPRIQVVVADIDGFIGRVDFVWDEARVIGESDGKVKYTVPADLYREKLREDRLRAQGFTVVRWGFADLRSPRLAERLRHLITAR
jgi:hypothetical protein